MGGRKPIFYAAADCHFPEEADGGAWRGLKAVRGDAVHAAGRLAAAAAADDVPLVLAGDLWDGPDPTPESTGQVYAALRGVTVYYVIGNHDRGRDWLTPMARVGLPVHRLDGRTFRDPAGWTITGTSYVPPASFADAVKSAPAADVGVYHQQWAEWTGGGSGVSLRCLPPHRVAVCGDVHVHARYYRPDGHGGADLSLSPGPLAPQSVVEFEPTRAFAVYADWTAETVEVLGRRYLSAVVNTARDAEQVLEKAAAMAPDPALPQHLATPVLAVRVVRAVDGLVEALGELAAAGNFVLRVVDAAPTARAVGTASVAPTARVGSDALAAVIAHWPNADAETRALAAAVTAEGADPDAALVRARADFELQHPEV